MGSKQATRAMTHYYPYLLLVPKQKAANFLIHDLAVKKYFHPKKYPLAAHRTIAKKYLQNCSVHVKVLVIFSSSRTATEHQNYSAHPASSSKGLCERHSYIHLHYSEFFNHNYLHAFFCFMWQGTQINQVSMVAMNETIYNKERKLKNALIATPLNPSTPTLIVIIVIPIVPLLYFHSNKVSI